ncbi:UDP-glucose/GDP-mannose dehydrogenase family protein [Arthrobacter sp. SDTb3-6]|uniref:UDP-glucose dehydrogenase family protein n=1 Tax=Arthrobacter sp. SDTb3-6 TaxID=2713571 RepID=UPI00159D1D0B|nr:UDP-glucose/GDP-mannose dehydrogenase family protein [Arthrobacter sp. SDTb3-6]NVM98453.1 UDP-glucose/GDP-mannose dehydrogenase family protein [Arthrobacter sp. SDTb3-6]
MKVSVIGCGYLGAVHAAALASLGHHVTGLDTDSAKVSQLARAGAPFHEPGLAALLQDGSASGRLTFTTDPVRLAGARVHFICVGTPQAKTGNGADLGQLRGAVEALRPCLAPGDLVVGKSTVPVGTSAGVAALLAGTGAMLAWNPEFLRQGTAVTDSLMPDRMVYGLPEGEDRRAARDMLDAVYAPFLERGTPCVATDYATAELIKVAANAFLALKLSYINAVGELCGQVGADVVDLAGALGHDARIGAGYLRAGVGFGGGCLPKDLRSFRVQAQEHGVESLDELLSLVDGINADARYRAAEAAVAMCDGQVAGRRITVLGAAFKPHTDDTRDSPALDIALQLAAQGAQVTVSDPQAAGHAWLAHPQLEFEPEALEALRGAELTMLLTEWAEFTALDPAEVAAVVDRPAMVDGRNALDAGAWRAAGWEYRGIGKGTGPHVGAARTAV